jgi:hypothetical protein
MLRWSSIPRCSQVRDLSGSRRSPVRTDRADLDRTARPTGRSRVDDDDVESADLLGVGGDVDRASR